MGYLIAAVVLIVIVLFIVCACMVGGRHDRYYFEKNVPVDNHGLSPFSTAIPKDEERALKTKELLAGYTYFFWNDPYGFGGEGQIRIVSWEPDSEEIARLLDKYFIAYVADFSYFDDGEKHELLCGHVCNPNDFDRNFRMAGGTFFGIILYPKASALEKYIDRFGGEEDDDRIGYEEWYYQNVMADDVIRFCGYVAYELNHEEE